MAIINFKKEFAELVASGKKRQTIRAMRKRPFKVGDKLFLYTGLRTKEARNLVETLYQCQPSNIQRIVFADYYKAVICKEVHDIRIPAYDLGNGQYRPQNIGIEVDGFWYNGDSNTADMIARNDGFSDFFNLLVWFEKTHGLLPFNGQLVRW